ncbi:MAG: hypothetical protein Q8L57_01355 [bacterium]|nr:hypothetical protein [bacterium]
MTGERWQKLSLIEQLANTGSEVFRALSEKNKGDGENLKNAARRALELIDLTLGDRRWKSKLLELGRLREAFCDFFFGQNEYNIAPDFLKNYFLPFAVLARRQAIGK